MPVSFYALISLMVLSVFLILLPFLGFPPSWNDVFTVIIGVLILGTSIYSFYRGYLIIISRMEKREEAAKRDESKSKVLNVKSKSEKE